MAESVMEAAPTVFRVARYSEMVRADAGIACRLELLHQLRKEAQAESY